MILWTRKTHKNSSDQLSKQKHKIHISWNDNDFYENLIRHIYQNASQNIVIVCVLSRHNHNFIHFYQPTKNKSKASLNSGTRIYIGFSSHQINQSIWARDTNIIWQFGEYEKTTILANEICSKIKEVIQMKTKMN